MCRPYRVTLQYAGQMLDISRKIIAAGGALRALRWREHRNVESINSNMCNDQTRNSGDVRKFKRMNRWETDNNDTIVCLFVRVLSYAFLNKHIVEQKRLACECLTIELASIDVSAYRWG